MIDPQSRSLEWIEQASGLIPNIADTALVEKAIRALSLLESLVRSGCPFVFKGGTALMLHLDTSRRLSIDVDIVCGFRLEEPKTGAVVKGGKAMDVRVYCLNR